MSPAIWPYTPKTKPNRVMWAIVNTYRPSTRAEARELLAELGFGKLAGHFVNQLSSWYRYNFTA